MAELFRSIYLSGLLDHYPGNLHLQVFVTISLAPKLSTTWKRPLYRLWSWGISRAADVILGVGDGPPTINAADCWILGLMLEKSSSRDEKK